MCCRKQRGADSKFAHPTVGGSRLCNLLYTVSNQVNLLSSLQKFKMIGGFGYYFLVHICSIQIRKYLNIFLANYITWSILTLEQKYQYASGWMESFDFIATTCQSKSSMAVPWMAEWSRPCIQPTCPVSVGG